MCSITFVMSTSAIFDGETASANIAYATSDQVFVFSHQTPSPVANTLEQLAKNNVQNIFSTSPTIQTFPAAIDPITRLHALLSTGALVSVLASSRSLLSSIPHLFKFSSGQNALVLHIAAEHKTHTSSFGDFSDVMAVRQIGLALLSSSSVQEAHDLAAIAHAASVKTHTPFLHFFDSRRVSTESTTIDTLSGSTLSQLISEADITAYRANLSHHQATLPTPVYLRYKQRTSSTFAESAPSIASTVLSVMTQFADLTGRRYLPLEYIGHSQATSVIVAMGAGATVVEHAVRALLQTDPENRIGLLRIRLYRPWSNADFLAAVPETATRIAVLEPTTDYTSMWNPVFLDVAATYQANGNNNVVVVSGRYGVEELDFSPRAAAAVFEHLQTEKDSVRRFIVGGEAKAEEPDMVVIPVEPRHGSIVDALPKGSRQAVVVSGQSVGSAQELAVVLGEAIAAGEEAEGKTVQVYSVPYGEGANVSHVRYLPKRLVPVPSLIVDADVVVIRDPVSTNAAEAIGRLAEGGSIVLCGPWSDNVKAVSAAVPAAIKRAIASKKAGLFVTDVSGYGEQIEDAALLVVLAELLFRNSPNARERAMEVVRFRFPRHVLQIETTTANKLKVPEDWANAFSSDSGTTVTNGRARNPQQQESVRLPVETPYVRLLDQVFQDRLNLANAINTASIWTPNTANPSASNPEFGYGLLLAQIQQRDRLVDLVQQTLNDATIPTPADLHKQLSQWLLAVRPANKKPSAHHKIVAIVDGVLPLLEAHRTVHPRIVEIYSQRKHLIPKSNWLLGSDTWSYDLGQSGLHHVVASGENINLLIVDTTPYSHPVDRERSKKDIGLYAMSFGSAYVASVAIYSSFTGVLNVLMEADSFPGPSVVLAYLPQPPGNPTAIDVLKDTKLAVDSGAWPLYRWDPRLEDEGRDPFSLDSERIRRDLEDFLERENHLSTLVAQQLDLSSSLVSSLESDVTRRHEELKRKSREDYARLLSGLSGEATGPPLTVLFGSDNGNAEGVAKKVAARAKTRGLKVKLMAMDDFSDPRELAGETNVVIVCCTAGQGEFPSNAREFWKTLNALTAADVTLADTRFAVFGLGDSHYWPRPEDAHYYNKPGKLIDAKLDALGAGKLTELGLGDDQDPDGFETGFQAWAPELWKALGVADVEADVEPPKFSDENNKLVSNYLRGTIAQELLDESTGGMKESDTKILKHHGSYMQDDRDLREERRKMGLEKAFSFMIRVRVPGGVATPAQWLALDELADQYAGHALKMTTRQAFQFHGVLKRNLKTSIRVINKALLSTLAACGDVNRNIMVNPNPHQSQLHAIVYDFSIRLMNHLAPRTSAYHEIWLDDKQVAGNAVQDFEPLYGPTYLPRKFKVVVAVPPSNDVDVYAHDLGYIAIVDNQGELAGYNVTVGGGMGMTHNNSKTYPRTADVVGFCTPDQAIDVGEKVLLVQRDYGDRTNRKHARFKYTIDDRGIDWFKGELESRLGYTLQPARPFHFTDNADRYGWTRGTDGRWHFCIYIENGKVKDWPDFPVKTGLRELAKWHRGDFRLTPNQHLIIANVPEEDLERTKAHLAQYKMDNLNFTGLRLNAMACVALPTCGLAMAESERYLPTLVTKLEETIEEAGLRDDAITIRMTGCPNGCARPYLAEIAFVGKAPGAYNLYLGGGHKGERLNKLYRESLKEDQILEEVRPIIRRYAKERNEGEAFGDWVIRAGYVKATTAGKNFHEL